MTLDELVEEAKANGEWLEANDDNDNDEDDELAQACDLLSDCQTLLDFMADLDIRKRITISLQKQMQGLAEEIEEFLNSVEPDDDEEDGEEVEE